MKYSFIIGKKYVFSKAFIKEKGLRTQDRTYIPAYHDYSDHFCHCDFFNRKLHDKSYPHKCGGRSTTGEDGQCKKPFSLFTKACTHRMRKRETFEAYAKNLLNKFVR